MNEEIKVIVKDNGIERTVRKMTDDEIDNGNTQYYCCDESGTIYAENELVFTTEEYVAEKCKQAYLQGAKDMREAVKIGNTDIADNDITSPIAVSFQTGYNMAIRKINRKAQQFIDSLEKDTK